MTKNIIDWLAKILVIIGAVNWGIIGTIGVDIIETVFSSTRWLAASFYLLIGLAGIYLIYTFTKT